MRLLALLVTATSLAGTAEANAFDADLSLAEKNRALDRFVVSDLTVGDTAFVDTYSLCWRDGKLMINGSHEVEKKSELDFSLKVTRVPGSSFTAEFVAPDKIEQNDRERVADDLYSSGECSFAGAWNINLGEFFPVLSINDTTSVSELISLIKSLGEN